MHHNNRKIALALLATSALVAPSVARAATPAPRFVDLIDSHGVDLVTGQTFLSMEEGGIGSGPGRVAMQRIWAEGATWVDNWSGGLFVSGGKTYVQVAGISETFTLAGGVYVNDKANGATLATVGGVLQFTARDGTKINFSAPGQSSFNNSCPGAAEGTCQVPTDITRPDGLKFSLVWNTWRECLAEVPGEGCTDWQTYQRLASVTSSAGYSLSIAYAANTPPGAFQYTPPAEGWDRRTTVTFNNSANPPSPQPTITYAYPDTSNPNTVDVTDPGGRTWKFTAAPGGPLTAVRPRAARPTTSPTSMAAAQQSRRRRTA